MHSAPISDNGGGIAEMSQLDEWVRERTDVLDAARNTTAAIGERFCDWFCGSGESRTVSELSASEPTLQEWTSSTRGFFTGLLFGAIMPYASRH